MRNCLVMPTLLLCMTVVLSGCGQRGPLYLPGTPAQPPVQEDTEPPES